MVAEMALVKPSNQVLHRHYVRHLTTYQIAGDLRKAVSPSKKAPKTTMIKEILLMPRFYTTNFDETEKLFNDEINKKLNPDEFEALLQEFKTDYNQTHFIMNKKFKEAAGKIDGPMRQIICEFVLN